MNISPDASNDVNPMGSVVGLYEGLASTPDDRTRAWVIGSASGRLEERYPHQPDLMWLIPLIFAQVGAMAAPVKLL